MRNRLFASFVAVAAVVGCATNGTDGGTTDSTVIADSGDMPPISAPPLAEISTIRLKGRWNLLPAMASDTATGRLPYLLFDTGRISGHTGCNSFSGGYTSSGASLSFGTNIISTKMACAGYDEAAFVKNLLRTTTFDVKSDTLVLKEDATPLSYWLKGN